MAQHVNARLRRQIGERLKELRLEAGVSSQETLAHKAGVHRTYMGRLERGESGVTVEALAALLAALGVSLSCSLLPRRFSAMHLTSHGRSLRRFQRVYRPLPY